MPRIIAFFITVALLAAPSSAWAVELVFWTTEVDADRVASIEFLSRAFEVMQDAVTVRVVSVNENDLIEKIQQAGAQGTLPHIIGTGGDLLAALGEEGVLGGDTPTRVVRMIGEERFYPGVLRTFLRPDGTHLYGVPFHGWVQGIWYRADWFEEAGLPAPCRWSDILKAAEYFHDPENGQYGILLGTSEDHYASQVFTQIALSNNARMFRPDGSVAFDQPRMVEALDFYARLARYTPPGPQSWRARDYFMQGKLAMMFYSTFIMDDLALKRVAANSLTGNNFPDLKGATFDPELVLNVRMVPLVCHKKKVGYGSINGFGFRRGLTEEEQGAVEAFMTFLYEPDHYVCWLHVAPGGMLPVLRDVAESNEFLSDPSGIFRRYGRDKIRSINDGLDLLWNFGMAGGKRQPAAAVAYARGVLSRMIVRTVSQGESPSSSVAQAAEEIRAITRSME